MGGGRRGASWLYAHMFAPPLLGGRAALRALTPPSANWLPQLSVLGGRRRAGHLCRAPRLTTTRAILTFTPRLVSPARVTLLLTHFWTLGGARHIPDQPAASTGNTSARRQPRAVLIR